MYRIRAMFGFPQQRQRERPQRQRRVPQQQQPPSVYQQFFPIGLFTRNGERSMAAALKEGADPNAQDSCGRTAVSYACASSGNIDTLKLLHRKGASFETPDHMGLTPLHYAALISNPDYVDVCMRLGADPNAKDHKGRTALHVACSNHTYNPHTNNKYPGSIVRCANRARGTGKQKECMDLLLNASIDLLEARDHQGRTPTYDCLTGVGAGVSWDLLTHVLERGADVTIVDSNKQNLVHHILHETRLACNATPGASCDLQAATSLQHQSLANKKPADTSSTTGSSLQMPPRVLFETQILVRLLVNLEPRLLTQVQPDSNGMTPFMTVCAWGNLDLIFYFMKEHQAIQELAKM